MSTSSTGVTPAGPAGPEAGLAAPTPYEHAPEVVPRWLRVSAGWSWRLLLLAALLYVAGLHGIWVINTKTLKVQGEYLKQQVFTSLAVSNNGQTLYAVDPATGITLLDPSSGTTRTVLKGAVQAPWGIEWAT